MSIRISQLKGHYISGYHSRYAKYVVAKYLDTATIKQNSKFHKTTLPHDMIFTKEDDSTSNEKAEVFSIDYNTHYRDFVRKLNYLISTKVDLCFAVQNMVKLSSNPGRVHFESLV